MDMQPYHYVAFELVDQNGAKIYDYTDSNGFLFSDEVKCEDEYAIISDCDDTDSSAEEIDLLNVDHGGNCDKESDKNDMCKGDESVYNKNQVREVPSIYSIDRNQAIKGTVSLSSHQSNAYVKMSHRQFDSKTTIVDDEEDKDDDVFIYGITSTPNKEYEMKIIAEPNDTTELVQSPDRNELEGKDTRRRSSISKLRELSTRIRRSFDEVQHNDGDECLDNIPLNDMRQFNRDIIYLHDQSNRKYEVPDQRTSVSDLEPNEVTLPRTKIRVIKGIDTKSINQHTTDKTYTDKCISRTKYDDNVESNEICDIEDQLFIEEIQDDSFFEIDDYTYRELVYTCECDPVELEMKTILNHSSSDDTDGLPIVTEFIHPQKVEMFRGREVTCRYISIFRQDKCKCKYITVAFVNINMPEEKLNGELDVPCEEVIEDIYSHFIKEVIVYDDDFDLDDNGVLPSVDDYWVLL